MSLIGSRSVKSTIISSLIILSVLFPPHAFAQSPKQLPDMELREKPKWVWNPATNKAEMSFDETKKLALLYNDYLFLHKSYKLQVSLVEELRLSITFQNGSHEALTRAFTVAEQERRRQLSANAELVVEKNQYKRWALNGDALPWVITLGALIFVGGMYAGVKLSSP